MDFKFLSLGRWGGRKEAKPAVLQSSGHEKVVEHARTAFGFGFFWQPEKTVKSAARQAQKAGKDLSLDVMVLRRESGPVQFGLGARRFGFRLGMLSGAAVLAASIREKSWVGVWAVKGGFVFVDVRRGLIQSDRDRFTIDEGHARDWLIESLKNVNFDRVFCPAGWAKEIKVLADIWVGDGTKTSADWAGVLDHSLFAENITRKPVECKATRIGGDTAFGLIFGYGLLASCFGLLLYVLLRITGLEGVLGLGKKVVIEKQPPHYAGKVVVDQVLSGCFQAILQRMKDDVGGYELFAVSCSDAGVVAQYQRGGLPISLLPLKTGSGIAVKVKDETLVEVSLPVVIAGARYDVASVLLEPDAVRRQAFGLKEVVDGEGGVDQPEQVTNVFGPARGVIRWRFDTKLSPMVWGGMVKNMGVTEIEKVGFASSSGKWHVEGRSYVR